MGVEGTRRSMGTKGAQRKVLSTLQPNPNPNVHRNPTMTHNRARNPSSSPSCSPSSKPRLGSELVWQCTVESDNVALVTMTKILGSCSIQST